MLDEVKLGDIIRLTSPHPYTLAVTVDKDGRPNAIGISWWTFTCMTPLMVAISVGHTRYSHENLKASGEFILVFPSDELAKEAWICGKKSGRDINKFDECGFEVTMAHETRTPLIGGTTAALEVKVKQEVETGDHTLFIGEVVAMHGDMDRQKHLYTTAYKNLFAFDPDGNKSDVEKE